MNNVLTLLLKRGECQFVNPWGLFMTDMLPPILPPQSRAQVQKKARGFFSSKVVKTISFYIISLCIVASVIACILAIWEFTKRDTLWRLIASFVVVAGGTALFAAVNGIFGDDPNS